MTAPAQPGAPRPQRSALLTFTQSMLVLQALAGVFVLITVAGLGRAGVLDAPAWFTGVGFAVVAAMVFAAGLQQRPWGRWLGTLLQAPMIAAGAVSLAIGFVGVLFLALWIGSLRLGTRIDRERAERLRDAES